MSPRSRSDDKFHVDLDKAYEDFMADRFEESIPLCRSIVEDKACPPYHKIKALLMLASSLEDWEEADDCCNQAEAAWQIAREALPKNCIAATAEVEEAFEELRDGLDRLRRAIDTDEDVPEDWAEREDTDSVVAGLLSRQYTAVEEAKAARTAQKGAVEEQLAAGSEMLDKSKEELRSKDVRSAYGGRDFSPSAREARD